MSLLVHRPHRRERVRGDLASSPVEDTGATGSATDDASDHATLLERRTAGHGIDKASPIRDAIIHVFETTLGLSKVGRDDDFFDLGGSSLLGVQVVESLETLLGRPVPLVLLFQEATPSAIASALERYPSDLSTHSMVLEAGQGGRSIFCLPDFFGLPLSYLGLARKLAPTYSVYGLAPGPLKARMIKQPSIPLLTRAYCDEIRSIQPDGPYILSGYSAGGVSAFDLACELNEDGERVMLVLLDPVINRGFPPLSFLGRWWSEQARPLISRLGWWAALHEMQRLRNSLLHVQRVVTPLNVPRGVPIGDRRFARSMLQAEVKWRERRFQGSAVLVQIGVQGPAEIFLDHDGMNGWSRFFAGEVDSFRVASDHMGLMREPHVSTLARRLLPFLTSFAPPDAATST